MDENGNGHQRVPINYSPEHIISLFNEMSKTYGAVNLLSSMGFSHLWRQACVSHLKIKPNHICADLMCGMGEATHLMLKEARELCVEAFDFCPEMTNRFAISLKQHAGIQVKTQNVFEIPPEPRYDRICCAFGIKTLTNEDQRTLAMLLKKILKPGGRASFVEIHVPAHPIIRVPYLIYMRLVIPLIGRLVLGNPDCYRHLALYTEQFAERDQFARFLEEEHFQVTMHPLFFGCARIYVADH